MSNSINLGLPFLAAAQAQKHVTHNEALRLLDTLVHLAVLDRHLATPPGTPAEGDRWIVAASPTGAWAGHAKHIAAWQDGAWQFSVPTKGWLAYVIDEGALLAWSGTAWVDALTMLTSLQNMILLGLGTTADATNPFSAKLNNALWTAKTVAEGGDGHLRYKLSKESAAKTLSFLLQNNFSGRAEVGLIGDDNLAFKVSPDGSAWKDALIIDRTTGLLTTLGQIKFPATANPSADANTLDDYEEGTFTPTFTASTTPPTGVTYSSQIGQYTKIGNVVNFYASLTLSSKGSGGAGRIEIAGLPFTVGPVSNILTAFWSLYTLTANCTMLCGFAMSGTTKVSFFQAGNNIAGLSTDWANASNTSGLTINGCYFI